MRWWTLVGGGLGRKLDHLKHALEAGSGTLSVSYLSLLLCSLRLTLCPGTYSVP